MNGIILVYNTQCRNECEVFFNEFHSDCKYLNDVCLLFTPDYDYPEYEDDLIVLNRGFSETAELIDNRHLEIIPTDNVRLLLTDNFFSQSYEQKTEIVLHELGHFLTNPILIKIRNYIANKNPSLLSIENADPLTDNLVGRFNESLSFLFQIPKLAQELHAEMWLYDNERDISKNRLRNYCNTLIDAIDEFRAANITSTFIFEIPRINFLLLFRKIVIENTDFDYTNNCLESIEIVYQEYSRLVISANLVHLQIYEKYNEHINCLDYSSLQEEELISTFNDVYDDYIRQAVTFFPPNIQQSILNYYNV